MVSWAMRRRRWEARGHFVVAWHNRGLGFAAPQVIAGDPVAAGSLDRRYCRRALFHGTLVGPAFGRAPRSLTCNCPARTGGRFQSADEPETVDSLDSTAQSYDLPGTCSVVTLTRPRSRNPSPPIRARRHACPSGKDADSGPRIYR